ncbi:GTP pyrophosphokinase [Salipaludibacillus neizhouensis]|uniref:GTP pyrophosphokinase n=1 Tax=Salipaludibacillus neizhouensis TaxID=885475 RepID=A0A3A9K9U0_9BACI|nr:GTP pyrophosphokinase family protein [Salipaludibacillus neizhouensis]RKL66413.1 GTP pyrophosphokinase [Salipaludibacillus neizhouensis]
MSEKSKIWKAFLLPYKFALDEMKTKINIMVEEAKYMRDENMIEHVKTRLKTPESIVSKLNRKKLKVSVSSARENLYDIAGVRVVCPFSSDVYDMYELLMKRKDLCVVDVKDYIRFPKPNGYQSLHMIIEVPITLSDRVEYVNVEVQLRTLAMDFWASLEHKIYYKYDKTIPKHLEKGLLEAAKTASAMDEKMKDIHDEVKRMDHTGGASSKIVSITGPHVKEEMNRDG